MSKEMNKLQSEITKYDMMSGLFMSLIIGLIFTISTAIVFLLGVMMALVNFRLSIYFSNRWLLTNRFLLIISTFLRIILVSISIIPLLNNIKLLSAYILGLVFHFLVLIVCPIKTKGSV